MIAKVLVTMFLIVPLILGVITFVILAIYLQEREVGNDTDS